MSLSKEQRIANMDKVLLLVFQELGSRWIRTFPINSSDALYRDIPPTTWLDLIDQAFIDKSTLRPLYLLTGHGWKTCLEMKGILDSPSFQETLGKVCAGLKNALKNRDQEELVSVADVARTNNLEPELISNVIDAHLIDYHLRRVGATWALKLEGKMLIIPANFGHVRLI